jgi:hypothetical protein
MRGVILVLADLVFLVYLYQRWVYPVDKKRVNEFGFGGTDATEEEGVKLLEGEAKAGDMVEGDRMGERRQEHLRSGITEEQVSQTAAGRKVIKAGTSVGSGSKSPAKDDKKRS